MLPSLHRHVFGQYCRWTRVRHHMSLPSKLCVCDVAGVLPLRHHHQGVTHHYTTAITDPYQRLYNNPMLMVEMLGVSLHSRGSSLMPGWRTVPRHHTHCSSRTYGNQCSLVALTLNGTQTRWSGRSRIIPYMTHDVVPLEYGYSLLISC